MNKAFVRLVILTLLASSLPSHAGRYYTDFDSGEPLGSRISGDAMVNPGAGINDSGMLRLTSPERGRQGAFIIDNFDGGNKVAGFIAEFKMQIGGGSSRGGDGVSFNFAREIPLSIVESGAPTGLVIAFDTFKEGGGRPEVLIKYDSAILKTVEVEKLRTGNSFVDVRIQLTTTKRLTVTYDGQSFVDCEIPGYTPISGAEFGFGARTGSAFDNHLIDELTIVTTVESEQP